MQIWSSSFKNETSLNMDKFVGNTIFGDWSPQDSKQHIHLQRLAGLRYVLCRMFNNNIQKAHKKGSDQSVWMCILACAYAVHFQQNNYIRSSKAWTCLFIDAWLPVSLNAYAYLPPPTERVLMIRLYMFKLMDKKIITILRLIFLLNWPYGYDSRYKVG